ncbi:hypothetical protein [Fusobacterium polymorphum]|jgi:hypothetical protein|uniref:hypothetical protein n=1 Tax=Fusobacterium nucleatum subsp. polymorphum TaxID=76857 RepID=UPI002048EDC9|nr:MAG TPA: DNA polymerase III subunit beta, DNA binding, Protein binding.8A [Caudoviricetes sp.]
MNIKEYNSQNAGKQILVLEENEIKSLMHFSTIAKNESINGLIVSGSYVGFTDTYRLAVVRDTREELPGTDTKIYSVSVLEELKKAKSMAVLKNGKLAIQVKDEVMEYDFIPNAKVPDIKLFINNYEYESYSSGKVVEKITDDIVWKMLKLVDSSDIKRYFSFEEGKLVVEAYPNGNSVLLLDVLELDNKVAKLKTTLNIKYIDLWLKYIKDDSFEIALAKNNKNAIQFSKDNLAYIVMPVSLRD